MFEVKIKSNNEESLFSCQRKGCSKFQNKVGLKGYEETLKRSQVGRLVKMTINMTTERMVNATTVEK